MSGRRAAAVLATLVLTGAAGCGGDEGSALQQTADRLDQIHGGDLDLELRLVPKGSAGIGVALRGPFALSAERRLPVADITYEQRAGATTRATFTSTGSRAWVTTQGRTVRLQGAQLQGLRVGAGKTQSLADLGLDVGSWIRKPRTGAGPRLDGVATERITGDLDAEQALGDLARASGQDGLGPDEGKRLGRTVSRSSITLVTGKEDRLLRSLRLRATLDVPPELRAKTGGTSALDVRLDLRLRGINRPVRVSAPPGAG